MKALIISESPLEKIGSRYYTVDPWITIPLHFSKVLEKVTLVSPVTEKPPETSARPDSWSIDSSCERLNLEHLDYYRRYIEYWKLLPRRFFLWKNKLNSLINTHDVVILRGPAPISSLVRNITVKNKKPLVLFILGDIATQPDQLYSPNIPKRYFYKIITKILLLEEKYTVKKSALVYAYSNDIYQRYKNINTKIHIVQDPHVSMKDFIYRDDTCCDSDNNHNKEIKILRIAWLIPSKGIEYVIEALKILRYNMGMNVRLEIVGQERKEGYLEKLKNKAKSEGVTEYVSFSGWVTYNKIGEVYLRNDIQVVSSLAEGIPRCIVEGFARGLPLVTTDVGGIKDFITDGENAIVVPPADSQKIAEAVARIIRDKELRRKLIKNGYEYAKKFSFETLGMEMIKDIEGIIHQNKT